MQSVTLDNHQPPAGDDADEPARVAVRPNRRRQRSRGQSLVEFALLLPVLVLILALAADFGRAFTAYIAISSAAREGAAFGMQSTIQANDGAGIQAAALADAPSIWGTAPTVSSYVDLNDGQGYKRVNVTVNYTFSTIMPIPPIPSSISMNRTVRMRVLN